MSRKLTKKEKRLLQVKEWLQFFSEGFFSAFNYKIEYCADAAEMINDCYWEIVEINIRPNLLKGKKATIDHHKIISVYEICVMHVKPILHDDEFEQIELNAKLAFYIAKTILIVWKKNTSLPDLPIFEREHETWLKRLDVEGHPYFSNAATWCLYEELCSLNDNIPSP